jgi:hypothetical protein
MKRVMVMKRATASATRVECDKEGDGSGGKSNGVEGGGQATATRAIATMMAKMWAMATTTRVAGDKEGNGAMATATWVAGM